MQRRHFKQTVPLQDRIASFAREAERKPLTFHLGQSAMLCLKKHGWPMLAPA